MVPGAVWARMIGNKVVASRAGTISMYPRPGDCDVSTMPNTAAEEGDHDGAVQVNGRLWL